MKKIDPKLDVANIKFFESKMSSVIDSNINYLDDKLDLKNNFDIIYRSLKVGGKTACIYYVNGFCKDYTMQKVVEFFLKIKEEDMPKDAHEMSKSFIPYVEVDLKDDWRDIEKDILTGILALFIDGFDKCLLLDARDYPSRGVSEPEKDKALRGSKDGFVETIICNTALIRRRIRSTDLRMEFVTAGKSSKTDIALCYMDTRVDKEFLEKIRKRIGEIKLDALTMNQESLAEALYTGRWYNPFPKFKYTERPDAAAAHVLEGSIIILVDNSPSAMILPTSIFDVIEEADDYYFPPITASYLRLARFLITILTYLLTPTFLLLMMYPQWIPESFAFIMIQDIQNIPILWQLLIMEVAIDGLRLAAVNTPNMLNTPFSIMAALVFGEFTVKSGWFNAEVMLYMVFVAIANYTQSNYEMAYALKFMRMITLILTAIFGVYGYIAGIGIFLIAIINNKTVSGQSYVYPLLPFNFTMIKKRLLRTRLEDARK